jgi:hypothetical protein
MHPSFVRPRALLAPLALLLVAAAPVIPGQPGIAAQRAPTRSAAAPARATVFDVTPYAGYMRFGQHVDGPLGTSLRSANAPVVGAQMGLAFGPNVGVVGNIAYGSADLEVGVPILGGIDVGTSRHLIYDANVELRMPMQGRQTVTPFVQAGAGAIQTHLENALVKASATNFAFNGGVGLDLSLGRGFGARAMVKDYVGRLDAKDRTGISVRGDVTHNVAGSLGVRLSF